MKTKLTKAQLERGSYRLCAIMAHKMCEANELYKLEELTEIQEQRLTILESQLDEAVEIIASKFTNAEKGFFVTKVGYYMDQVERFGRPGNN